MHDERSRRVVALSLASGGALYGLVVAILALFMAGAGHGWGEGLFSAAAIVLVPLAGVAWAYRHRVVGLVIASLVVAAAASLDWFLMTHTSYVDRVWQHLPGVLAGWALLWVAWQLPALWVLASRLFSRAE